VALAVSCGGSFHGAHEHAKGDEIREPEPPIDIDPPASAEGGILKMRRFLVALSAALVLFALVPTTAIAASGVPYTIHGVDQQTFVDEGLCSPSATITLDGRFVLHVNATEEGLTDEDILDALFTGDPEGILLSVTFTETGTFSVVESTGQTITGRFTQWFGGNINHDGHTIVFTGTFSATGVDQDGNHIVAAFTDHVTIVNGEPVVEFERGSARGCA
jgi:hypothetical protein